MPRYHKQWTLVEAEVGRRLQKTLLGNKKLASTWTNSSVNSKDKDANPDSEPCAPMTKITTLWPAGFLVIYQVQKEFS